MPFAEGPYSDGSGLSFDNLKAFENPHGWGAGFPVWTGGDPDYSGASGFYFTHITTSCVTYDEIFGLPADVDYCNIFVGPPETDEQTVTTPWNESPYGPPGSPGSPGGPYTIPGPFASVSLSWSFDGHPTTESEISSYKGYPLGTGCDPAPPAGFGGCEGDPHDPTPGEVEVLGKVDGGSFFEIELLNLDGSGTASTWQAAMLDGEMWLVNPDPPEYAGYDITDEALSVLWPIEQLPTTFTFNFRFWEIVRVDAGLPLANVWIWDYLTPPATRSWQCIL